MEMDDNKLKRFLQDELDKEADEMMEMVNQDPDVRDAVAPDHIFEKLQKQIQESEAADVLTSEERELIRLGKIYKKKRSRRKYYVLVAAVVALLAFGMTSLGDGKKIIQEVKDMIAGKEQTLTGESDGDTIEVKSVDIVEFYDEVKEKFGFDPVHMDYMPEGMFLEEALVEEEMQAARIRYTDGKDRSISCRIFTGHRENSVGLDIEDGVIKEYKKEVGEISINIKEYNAEESEIENWLVSFVYANNQYVITIRDLGQGEVEKIVENLKIF